MSKSNKEIFGRRNGSKPPKNQGDFLNLAPVPPRYTGGSTVTHDLDVEAEVKLNKLHAAFNARGRDELTRLLNPDAQHDTRKFYKEIGWTEKAKTEAMMGHWSVAMFRLKEVGVFDRITPTMTLEEQQEILQILSDYDRDHKMSGRKWLQFAIDAGKYTRGR